MINQFSSDIKKFGMVLKIIQWTMPVLGLVPIRIMLRMFFFTKDFGDKMVYPLIALFLGTGNQVRHDSVAYLLFFSSSRCAGAFIVYMFAVLPRLSFPVFPAFYSPN